MRVHFLDMGPKKYGDCIVITKGDKKILIDGAHPGDASFILLQLKKILGQAPPYEFDLLVVTHCHSDHIGCLPELVKTGDITAKAALLADPDFRWGKNSEAVDGFIDSLFEEDHSDLKDNEIEQFLFDAERLYPGYLSMITSLKEQGDVYLFQGANAEDYSNLLRKFKSFGMEILGPSNRHLKITQESLIGATDAVRQFINESADTDSIKSLVDLYKQIQKHGTIDNYITIDAKKNKGAINDQSIVLKFTSDGWNVLLAGDMQFADAEVSGLENEMENLLQDVYKAGPFDLVKTCHHTSYNGLDEEMLSKWIEQGTQLYVHSGGKRDATHPEPEVLTTLKDQRSNISFARTDRNGIISIEKKQGEVTMSVTKGRINDFTPNVSDDTVSASPEITSSNPQPAPRSIKPPLASSNDIKDGVGNVLVTAAIPINLGQVTITVSIDSKKKVTTESVIANNANYNDSSRLRNLLFVTNKEQLRLNIGSKEAEEAFNILNTVNNSILLNVPFFSKAADAARFIRSAITEDIKGVVILGGYDVLPAAQLNVLTNELRARIDAEGGCDPDDFIVWSDDVYVDIDEDGLPELPVSRIPDGKSAVMLLKGLQSAPFKIERKFGIRNIKRPFAIDIFEAMPHKTTGKLEVSESCSPTSISDDTAKGAVYYMLHGHDIDATRFYGETVRGGMYEAFDITNVPQNCDGTVIFSGCCWGALIALPKASKKLQSTPVRPRTAELSIPLAYLKAGANAFVGCTGAHYSPSKQGEYFFGQPMHDAFWTNLKSGLPPASALFKAKKEYAANIPHGLTKATSQGIEIKILHQFTCLGLGW